MNTPPMEWLPDMPYINGYKKVVPYVWVKLRLTKAVVLFLFTKWKIILQT